MFVKFLPSEYVLKYKNGRVVKEGLGLSFFYMEKNTTACMIPMQHHDVDFMFEERTLDHQSVCVQGQLTYRIADFQAALSAVDFSIQLKTKAYYHDPFAVLSKRLVNMARVIVKKQINAMELSQAIANEKAFAQTVQRDIADLPELKALGIAPAGVSILAVVPAKETMRALEAKTRESILKQSDNALYERRYAAIEQERKIKENELNTDIAVEEKKKQIKENEIAAKKMVVEQENEFEIMKVENQAKSERIKIAALIEVEQQRKQLETLKLENAKMQADAEAYRIRAVMQAYNELNKDVLVALATLNMEPEKMIAKAFDSLAQNSQKIGSLNISPELLESLKVQ
ncbi:MAG: SPFH domain-containing protein [Clostridia bacterium]|nr:SPFH domain-containing protein [Clostridia bacterium]